MSVQENERINKEYAYFFAFFVAVPSSSACGRLLIAELL